MNRYGFKRLMAILLACIMTMGCCAFATEEMEATVQEPVLAEEQNVNAAAADATDAQLSNDAEPEENAPTEIPQPDGDASPEAAPAGEEAEAAAEDGVTVANTGALLYEECAHAHTDSYAGMRDVVYTPVDDKYHETSGYAVTVVYCTDCRLTLSEDVDDERSSRQDRHNFWNEDGSCYYCGAENTCPHSNTITDEYWHDVEDIPIDDQTHERRGHRITHTWCEDCDMTLSEEVSTEITSVIERHCFEDGVCYRCGAENTCPHSNTITDESWRDAEFIPIDDAAHEIRGHRVTHTWCEDCDMTLSEEVSTELFSEIGRHWFEDGVCYDCGYENTCPHTNTEEERYPSDDGEFTAIDGHRHEWCGHEVIELRCMDCEETLSRELSQELVSQVWDHNFNDGVCYECGYVNTCPHNYSFVNIDFDNGMATVTPVDDACHEYSGYPWYYEFCCECGEALKRWRAEDPVTLLQNHYFEDGYCYECGYSIDCSHKRIETWTYFEGSSFENAGSDRYHIAHGNFYTYKQCMDCNEMIFRTARECTKKESHNYVNGKCSDCGYANPCDHSKTKESRGCMDSGYTNLTATTHTYTAFWSKDIYCAICGEHLGCESTGEVTIETEKHDFSRDAVCICGQRNTCKHNGKINERVYWMGDIIYTPVDGTYHMTEGTQCKDYTCALCGRIMKSEVLGHVKKKVEHNFSEYRGYCWSCYADGSAEAPKSVSIVQQNQKLNIGETLQLTAEVTPAGAATSLSWSSSDKKTATVDANGLVTPIKEGSVTITVRTANGKSGTAKITVVDPYKPTAVKLDQTGTVTLKMGETLTLNPILSPETAQATYSWKSSATKTATVTDGVVTPVAEGTATITVTATRGSVKKTATVKVKVVDPLKPTAVKLDQTGTVWLELGETLQLNPILSPATAEATYSWKSSAAKIATVDENGFVRPVSKGTATITVTATRGSVKKTATVKVKVVEPNVVDAIVLSHKNAPNALRIKQGERSEIGVQVKPASASETANLSFTSSSGCVAVLQDESGVYIVEGVKAGRSTITVKDVNTGVKATIQVTVTK